MIRDRETLIVGLNRTENPCVGGSIPSRATTISTLTEISTVSVGVFFQLHLTTLPLYSYIIKLNNYTL